MKNHTQAKNITELFHSISKVRSQVLNGELEIPEAESSNNSAGKMIKIAAIKASFVSIDEAKNIDILK